MAKNIVASFPIDTAEGKIKLFNAMNGASVSLKNVPAGEIIEVVGVLQYTDKVDSYGAEQDATITVLFASDGQSYAGVSDTVAQAAENLLPMFESFEVINIAIVKQKSAKGQEFINLRAVL